MYGDGTPISIGPEELNLLRNILSKSLNGKQLLIMEAIQRTKGESLHRILHRISESHGIPLSTLKFHSNILLELGLIEKVLSNGRKRVRVSRLGRKLLMILNGSKVDEDVEVPESIDSLSMELKIRLIEFLKRINGFHLGSSLSTLNILIAIFTYRQLTNKSITSTKLVLSKGHAAPALYIVLNHLGVINDEILRDAFSCDSIIQTHPIKNCPTVVFSSGSLGQGISIANGLAIKMEMDRDYDDIYVILGDGELDEGQVWEALATSSSKGLDNILLFIDRNGKQLSGATEEVKRKEPLADKLRSFGWEVFEVDGSKPSNILKKIFISKCLAGWPKAIIVHTSKEIQGIGMR